MKKFLIISFVSLWVLAGLVILILLIFPQIPIFAFTKLKFSPEKAPDLYIVPKDRLVQKVEYGESSSFSYYGLTFELLCNKEPTIKALKSATVLTCPNGKSLAVFSTEATINLADALRGKNTKDAEKVEGFFGKEALESNYKFYNFTFETTPEDISLFTSSKEASGRAVILTLKKSLMETPSTKGGIYRFSTSSIKGFQKGDPDRGDKIVFINLFDQKDRQWDLLFKNATQEEIDFTLSSTVSD